MRVLVQIRTNRGERDGGDTLHAECKAAELRALGLEVDVTGDWATDPSGYDLVHLYNTAVIEPTLRRALRARGNRVPIVIETIYWDTSYSHPPLLHRHEQGMRRVALLLAERAIPSSETEAKELRASFPEIARRLRVVPLGVDARADIADGDGDGFCERHGLEPGFVLCAGRKELRKNQLRLIRACARSGARLVLAGAEHPENSAYVADCRAAAADSGADVRFLPHLEGAELAGAFAAASVHAQPSLRETVGLSSLEAALAGCTVVTTCKSGISDYLGADAWYCDPWSEESIGEALAAARAAPAPAGVAERLRDRFTWRRAAEETLVVYEEAMKAHERRAGKPRLPDGQYAEHLEELVQLQLEAIAFRDEGIAAVHSHAENLDGQVARARAETDQVRAELEQTRGELARERAETKTLWEHLEQTRATLVQTGAALEQSGAALERSGAALEKTGTALEQSGAALTQTRVALEQSEATVGRTRAELDDSRAEIDRLHATRLFRWAAPFRAVYARMRRL